MRGNINHFVRIEIQAYHGVVALWLCWLFLNGDSVFVGVKLYYTVALGIVDAVTEDTSFSFVSHSLYGAFQEAWHAVSIEDVISQDQTGVIVANEVASYDECLGQAVGTGLFSILQPDAVVASVAQQTLEHGQVLRGGDDEDVSDAGQHQYRDGVVHHRFVVDGYQLFADAFCYGIEACSAASGQYNAFHLCDGLYHLRLQKYK